MVLLRNFFFLLLRQLLPAESVIALLALRPIFRRLTPASGDLLLQLLPAGFHLLRGHYPQLIAVRFRIFLCILQHFLIILLQCVELIKERFQIRNLTLLFRNIIPVIAVILVVISIIVVVTAAAFSQISIAVVVYPCVLRHAPGGYRQKIFKPVSDIPPKPPAFLIIIFQYFSQLPERRSPWLIPHKPCNAPQRQRNAQSENHKTNCLFPVFPFCIQCPTPPLNILALSDSVPFFHVCA